MTTMADVAAWHDVNDAYLEAAVAWVRLLLASTVESRAVVRAAPPTLSRPPEAPMATARPVDQGPQPAWWKFRRTVVSAPSVTVTELRGPATPQALPPSSLSSADQAVEVARARMEAAEQCEPPPALVVLARRLELSSFERNVLLLCIAMELDTGVGALCAQSQDDPSLPFPTFGLAFRLFDEAAWDARSPQHPLRYWRLVEPNQPWGQPLMSSALRADERIVNYVKGLTHLDERLTPFLGPIRDAAPTELPPTQAAVVDAILAAIDEDRSASGPLQLVGRESEGRQLVAAAVAHRLGLSLYRLHADVLPGQPVELETLVRLWQRETLLTPLALYVDGADPERTADSRVSPLGRFLARAGGVVFVESREPSAALRASRVFDVDRPTAGEQRALWATALGEGHDATAGELAARYSLDQVTIARLASAASAGGTDQPMTERLLTGAAQHTRLRIDMLAQRIDAKATWDDIVLPASEETLLRQIAAHVEGRSTVYDDWGFRARMNRGFGVSALFAGASGTGKTMAAEVIANDLGQTLHRVDLSSVVSKWVGETEKNLQQVFNAADDATGILFFDEADALFGKRTEVQQSQDRFANIEINFLLQRLEAYRGLAILATNMKAALDPAFLRRLRFVVNFPFPGPAERRRIWERAFPAQAPVDGLDLERLARLPLTGGSVHNVALSAAFLAAKRRRPVTMDLVFEAARTELRKIDKPINEADLAWTAPRAEPTR